MTLSPEQPAVEALKFLHAGFEVVVDGDRFLGTVTDRSVRHRILATSDHDGLLVRDVLDDEAVVVGPHAADEEVRRLMEEHHVRGVAVVDGHQLVGIKRGADVGAVHPQATAVVMAGGRGQRLMPLTDKVPKPLLAIGRASILERLLESFHHANVDDVWIAVNYMSDLIEDRVGDGSAWGVNVRFLHEDVPLHTAGALSLLPERPTGPILVTHADQVTSLQWARMVDYHLAEGADITVGAFYHSVDIPYGVLTVEGRQLVGIEEKPTLRWPVNAGFYVLSPTVLDLVPKGERFSGVDLFEAAVAEGRKVGVFPIVETLIDIGNWEDLNRALLWFATGEDHLA